MNLLVCLDEDPLRNMPVWAALTDAVRAVPGIRFVLVGSAPALELMRRHPAVSDCLLRPAALAGRAFSWFAWRAGRRISAAIQGWAVPPTLLIDPFGNPSNRRLAQSVAVRSIGVATSTGADRNYTSVFPLPEALHAVQSVRVLFAAALGYSLHDLAPDFGLPLAESWVDDFDADGLRVDLLVDWQGMAWSEAEQTQLREHLAASQLRVAYLSIEPSAENRLADDIPLLESAHYLLSGNSPLAWFAAAIGKPGLCVCAEGSAKTTGVISTRFARQKMLNIDDPALTRPQVVAESIIQALSRQGAQAL